MPQVSHSITYDEHEPPTRINPELPSMLDFVVARALKKDPAVRYQDADEMAADLHTCLAELRSREEGSDPAGEASKTVKLGDSGEPTVGAPAANAIATDTRLPVSRHFDSTVALKRLAKSQRTGRSPRAVGVLRRIAYDALPRRLFVVTALAAAAGSLIAFI
jgi:serine/threonine-protein kinase